MVCSSVLERTIEGKVATVAHSRPSPLLACECWPQLHGEAGNRLGVEEQWCPSEAPGLQFWPGTALFLPLARGVLPAGRRRQTVLPAPWPAARTSLHCLQQLPSCLGGGPTPSPLCEVVTASQRVSRSSHCDLWGQARVRPGRAQTVAQCDLVR